VVRLLLGETGERLDSDQIWVLETNLDDISGELIGHCASLLAEAGALDVYTAAIQMKKNRPGVLLSVLSPPEIVAKLEKIIFRETATLGIRRWPVSRHKLERRPHTVETQWGPVLGKLATLADGSASFSPEYEACRIVAVQHAVPLKDVYEVARKAYKG
jgi:uncharacterized protein (DUF111 family)